MSDYPMLISNKLHSFRNFGAAKVRINRVQSEFYAYRNGVSASRSRRYAKAVVILRRYQTIGSFPWLRRYSLACEKCRQPKNPR